MDKSDSNNNPNNNVTGFQDNPLANSYDLANSDDKYTYDPYDNEKSVEYEDEKSVAYADVDGQEPDINRHNMYDPYKENEKLDVNRYPYEDSGEEPDINRRSNNNSINTDKDLADFKKMQEYDKKEPRGGRKKSRKSRRKRTHHRRRKSSKRRTRSRK